MRSLSAPTEAEEPQTKKRKTHVRLKTFHRIATLLTACAVSGSAAAQGSTPGQLLDKLLDSGRHGNQPAQPAQGGQPLPSGMSPAAKPAEPQRETPWRTKAELLAAVRDGEFRGLPEIRVNQAEQTAPLTDSVIHILRHEYGVPTLSTGKTAGSMTCRSQASEEVRRLLTSITALHFATLSDKPPTFYKDAPTQSLEQTIQMSLKSLGMGDGLCSTKVMGVEHPHPYGAALRQLADDFGSATKDYVESQRATRKADYDAEQARIVAEQKAKADADAKLAAEARAAEQARIDAERARIQKQQQQQQGRIAG